MSTPPPSPKPSGRAVQSERARNRRASLAKQDQDLFEILACGHSYEAVAQEMGVSVATLRRRIDRVIAKRSLDAPHKYMHFQIERLNKGLALANMAIETKDLKGIELMIKLVDRLDRYHGLAHLHRVSPAPPREPMAALLGPPASLLALGHAPPPLAITGPAVPEEAAEPS